MKRLFLLIALIAFIASASYAQKPVKYKFYQHELYLGDVLNSNNTPEDNGMALRTRIALERYDLYYVTDSFAIDIVEFPKHATINFFPSGQFSVTDKITYNGSFIVSGPFKIHEVTDSIISSNVRYIDSYPEWFGDTSSAYREKVERLFPIKAGANSYYDTTINNYYYDTTIVYQTFDTTIINNFYDTTYNYFDTTYIVNNYFGNDTNYFFKYDTLGEMPIITVHSKTDIHGRIPLIDFVTEFNESQKGDGGVLRGFIKDGDSLHQVTYFGMGRSDTKKDGKFWIYSYWSVDQKYHGIVVDKDFVWFSDMAVFRNWLVFPPILRPGAIFRYKGYFWNVHSDSSAHKFLDDSYLDLFRQVPEFD